MAKEKKTESMQERSTKASESEGKKYASYAEHPAFKTDKSKRPGVLSSRLDHPVTISYEGRAMIIPPRAKVDVADTELLGALPSGIALQKK